MLSCGPENPGYTFDTFVVSRKSRAAFSACAAVAANPGRGRNPLILSGATGSGKTHLLHAIAQSIRSRHAASNVLRVTCEAFLAGLIHAIRYDDAAAFRDSVLAVDALLLDDLPAVGDRPHSREEILSLTRALVNRRVQVVMTCTASPELGFTHESIHVGVTREVWERRRAAAVNFRATSAAAPATRASRAFPA